MSTWALLLRGRWSSFLCPIVYSQARNRLVGKRFFGRALIVLARKAGEEGTRCERNGEVRGTRWKCPHLSHPASLCFATHGPLSSLAFRRRRRFITLSDEILNLKLRSLSPSAGRKRIGARPRLATAQPFRFPSSRRKSGPRLATSTHAESLGPGVRRDDGSKRSFAGAMVSWPLKKRPPASAAGRKTALRRLSVLPSPVWVFSSRGCFSADPWPFVFSSIGVLRLILRQMGRISQSGCGLINGNKRNNEGLPPLSHYYRTRA